MSALARRVAEPRNSALEMVGKRPPASLKREQAHPRRTRTRWITPSSANGIAGAVRNELERQRHAVELYALDSTADAARVLDRDVVARGAVAEDDLKSPPRLRHARVDEQGGTAHAKSEDPFYSCAI